ncbi:Ger(x)C family spore germination protein [Desulfofundulus thermocisternus]|uniref:Ger(x)C family spore germination protein n=1 Tax=Desulfofundulus thermocisternus TaxID=42471 RepID=UPI0019F67C05|nr:Ger(x)C family spore germination protein [Desulfofundulus thermocisternus]MBE3585204.1 Ger(x)C family spore germination protein [Thermoanaerobacter sp.]MCS5696047.1 Ger(x)C family spore germination protein [Desulfofundulus thermocisternus]
MKKRIAALLLITFIIILAGGCWNRVELTELAIVLGAGVDLAEDGRILLTLQIARPGAFTAGNEGGGRGKEAASWVISAEGRTVPEAERFLAMKIPRHIYWGHCIILVLGEELARREGTGIVTNFFQREREPRENIYVLVARGRARDFLETYSSLERTSAQAAGFLERMKTGYTVQLRELAEMLVSRGIQPAVTAVEVTEAGTMPGQVPGGSPPPQKEVGVAGTAVFKQDKLIGWLDPWETRGFLWLKGEIMKGVIIVPGPEQPEKLVSIRIRRGKTKIIPEYNGEYPRFLVKIQVEGDMVEQQTRENLATPEKIKLLEEEMASEIKARAEAALDKVQGEYGVDIFGFGEAFHRKYKKEWRKLKYRWDEEFSRAEVEIAVNAQIREIGLLTRRAGIPEE